MTKTFFVEAALAANEDRWRLIFHLCWDESKGFGVNLADVPDRILKKFWRWRNERVEEENAKMPRI